MEGDYSGPTTTIQGARLTASRWLVAFLAIGSLAACPSAERRRDDAPLDRSAEYLVGIWEQPEGTTLEFEKIDGEVRATAILDTDGEEFEIKSFGYVDGNWQLVYFVPSTAIWITLKFARAEIGAHEVFYEWVNSANDKGREPLTRLPE